jgi:hypothetical protein
MGHTKDATYGIRRTRNQDILAHNFDTVKVDKSAAVGAKFEMFAADIFLFQA